MCGYDIYKESKNYNEFAEILIEHNGELYKITEDDFRMIYDSDSDSDRLVISIQQKGCDDMLKDKNGLET